MTGEGLQHRHIFDEHGRCAACDAARRTTVYPRAELREYSQADQEWVQITWEGTLTEPTVTSQWIASMNADHLTVRLRDGDVVAEPSHTPWADEVDTGQSWMQEVNQRIAADEELMRERAAAYLRAQRSEQEIYEREDAEWAEAEQRQVRGEKIPERPVVLSWLGGERVIR